MNETVLCFNENTVANTRARSLWYLRTWPPSIHRPRTIKAQRLLLHGVFGGKIDSLIMHAPLRVRQKYIDFFYLMIMVMVETLGFIVAVGFRRT